jgi:sugar/nucleoside kinase (ribokinase family)
MLSTAPLPGARARLISLTEAVRIAVAAASASSEHAGAREGMLTAAQLAVRTGGLTALTALT